MWNLIRLRSHGVFASLSWNTLIVSCHVSDICTYIGNPYTHKYARLTGAHCSAHSLNLAINDACKINVVRNTVGSVSSVCNFFRGSAQRTDVLKKHVINHFPSSRHTVLLSMCETRWVLRHDAINRFKEIYILIIHALEDL